MSVEQNLEKKRALLEEIKQTRKGLDRLQVLDGLYRERWDAHTRIEGMKARYGADMSRWPGHVQTEYHKAKSTVDSADSKVQACKDNKAKIDARLNELQGELAGLDQQITIDDIKPMQTTVNDGAQKIGNLRALIADEEGRAATIGRGDNGAFGKLVKEKEDLLADIACGESTDHERLASLDIEITHEEERRGNQERALATSTQKISGLRRKLEQTIGEYTVAKQNLLDGLAVFLEQELENAGGAYVEQAINLAAAYSKVIAIAAILEKCGAPKNVFGTYTRGFNIPSFLLDTCMVNDITDMPGMLFQFSGSAVQEQLDSEIERFGRIGISIPDGMPASL